MREIKFRAWDRSKNLMSPVWTIGFKAWDWPDVALNRLELEDNGTYDADLMREGNIVLMQYTGLKDKNGKEIWEGDVIHVPAKKRWRSGVVNYSEITGSFKVEAIDLFDIIGKKSSLFYDENAYVAGNVYENPELVAL